MNYKEQIKKIYQIIEITGKRIYDSLNKTKKTVAFVSYLPNLRNHTGNLHLQFKEAGYNVINIIHRVMNDRFESLAPTYLIPKAIETPYGIYSFKVDFDFIDLIIMPDYESIIIGDLDPKFLSKKAKRIYLPHDIVDAMGIRDEMDFVIIPSKDCFEIHKKKPYRKGFCLIPGGYPKLDYSIEKYNEFKKENRFKEDLILFANTMKEETENLVFKSATYSMGTDYHIIKTLLENFNEIVSFRPHPNDLYFNHYNVPAVINKFKDNPRFIANLDYRYLETYVRAKFLVTDISDTSFTFSFSTLKPSIFYAPLLDIEKDKIPLDDKYAGRIGFKVKNNRELISAGKEILQNPLKISNQIREFRDNLLFNINKSGEYLIENIDYILTNKKHPDWYYF